MSLQTQVRALIKEVGVKDLLRAIAFDRTCDAQLALDVGDAQKAKALLAQHDAIKKLAKEMKL